MQALEVQKQWLKPKWNSNSQSASAIPEDFAVDQESRFTGTVQEFKKWQGFGFLILTTKGVIPNDKLFVHWSNIHTEDRFPSLVKDQEVEFNIMKYKESKKYGGHYTLRAKMVTQVGGAAIAVQDEQDANEMSFVGGQHLRYTGTLKWFDPNGGFGFVVLDDGFALDEAVPKEMRVELQEVNCAGKRPGYMEKLAVEFGIVKTEMDFMAYNMTLPGGLPMSRDNLEHRIVSSSGQVYKGVISSWKSWEGFGNIQLPPEGMAALPADVLTKIAQGQEAMKAKGKEPRPGADSEIYFRKDDCREKDLFWPRTGMTVTFQIYIDDKGVGAFDVAEVPGAPTEGVSMTPNA
eukprot:gnl/TRDRNA2_/TRDRNA2_190009_c0_seq1.p1 gnl/TRDRNA2_/TRDRNA2_190009_c0~~gnl/TRDRNA2_/TRDRNA2_190009_c0_seq1.p1  ORF type:complete len:359 (-),score=80.30 gnl/TRDRNA2_/TRDRNA2_190009_c0_seq1:46-1086(-)